MIELTEVDILIGVLAILAGCGVAMYVVLTRRKWVAFKKRCFDVAHIAQEQGFDLLAELLESITTEDLVEGGQEIEYLLRMFKEPGALMNHLDKLFAKQTELRLADPVKRIALLKAVDDWRALQDAARKAMIAEIEAEKALTAAKALV